tara:strand:- start:23764 stop:24012 length:249 start_codon:yes stop_codon:yes gene_type:complete
MLVLYTKDKCVYCHFLKEKLDDWGLEYETVNNEPLPKGHSTYPQLYYKGRDVQLGSSTDLDRENLEQRIERIEWPNIDGGIE